MPYERPEEEVSRAELRRELTHDAFSLRSGSAAEPSSSTKSGGDRLSLDADRYALWLVSYSKPEEFVAARRSSCRFVRESR